MTRVACGVWLAPQTLSGAENKQNWGKALMRFEFVEVIVRLALHKYCIEVRQRRAARLGGGAEQS